MARRFPEDPEFPPGRAAEAVVFETLADNLPDEAAVFWSIPFTDDHGETEADVIVACVGVGRRGPTRRSGPRHQHRLHRRNLAARHGDLGVFGQQGGRPPAQPAP